MASSLSLAVYIVGLVLASVFLVGKVLVNAIVGAGIGPVLNVTGDISSDNPSEVWQLIISREPNHTMTTHTYINHCLTSTFFITRRITKVTKSLSVFR